MSVLSAVYGRVARLRRSWYQQRPQARRQLDRPVISVGNLVVGGSLVPAGGHNILEPAVHGRPIIFGPHMDNFAEIADAFLTKGAAIQVRTDRELEDAVVSLMADPVRRTRLGAAARALVDDNRGSKDKTLNVLAELLPPDGPRAVVRPFRLVH